ncbi:PRC-barrel domain-containing protein [Roseomonas sp. E05]|uniref:PRC-barrel domain-containing protein n=1 Tax=Roseomonas sp. E05 TaxID=3046310 RepID=UPI0024BB69E1|nr:PRC-barrel domain-containing protein [Roseomonas sp. E05]MDJ0388030.1 PRC-barrel domain-containing protein [Roseomonas sp. E05]
MPIAHAIPGRKSCVPLPALLLLFASLSFPALAAEDEETTEAAPAIGQEPLPKDATFRVLGSEVKGPSGIVVGQVVNVLVDEGGSPRAVVLDYGGFLGVGKRRIAVAWPLVRFGAKGALLSLTREQLKAFPEYRDGEDAVMATPVAQPH